MNYYTFYQEFFVKIYRYVYYRTGANVALAEDLTSEIFLKAFDAYNASGEITLSQSWIFRIAKNHLTDYYRVHIKKMTLPLDDFDFPGEENIVKALQTKELRKKICATILKLSDNHQNILILKYINELDNNDIAEMMGISPGATRARVHEAVKALRAKINKKDLKDIAEV